MAYSEETYAGYIQRKLTEKRERIDVAAGRRKADIVLKNATYVNVFSNELCHGDIAIAKGQIVGIGAYDGIEEYDVSGKIVCPGFMDAHIHLESSLVVPKEFAKAVLPHGTTTVITDPHEITNIMGTDGIDYMLQATEGLPVDVLFMLPSCVPATPMDESGASLDYRAIDSFYAHDRVLGLAEMMNYPGVISGDGEVVSKIVAAQAHHMRIDGHAPNLQGKDLAAYISAGVYSDHECMNIEDAMEKLRNGQYIMIREGTAAKNLDALVDLLKESYYDRCMFCTDDKHPIDLLKKGHIDYIAKKAIEKGVNPIVAVKAATLNPARYFHLNNRGAIAPGYLADIVVIDCFENFQTEIVFKNGKKVFSDARVIPIESPQIDSYVSSHAHNTFHVQKLCEKDFCDSRQRGVIGIIPNEIITTDRGYASNIDITSDTLKMAVIERHKGTRHIGIGYLQGYGLKRGAIATSISHDSHNIIVVGTNEADMAFAANRVVANSGGIVVAEGKTVRSEIALEIAGLMSEASLEDVNEKLETTKKAAFDMGVSDGTDPFMTLSFMSLPVIPALRLTTRGVIDVTTGQYI